MKNTARLISRITKINRETIRRIIKKDLQLNPYRYVNTTVLTEKEKQKRKLFAQFWRKLHKKKFFRMPVYFSDENFFTMEEGHNRKNRVVYSDSNENAIKKW